jgi:hypothetical protein
VAIDGTKYMLAVTANRAKVAIMSSTLNDLLVSEKDISSEVLHSALHGLIQIGKEKGNVIPTAAFSKLDRNTKVLVYLLGLRAASALGVATKEDASVAEIGAIMGIDAKSAGEYASRLKREFLTKTDAGYAISPDKLQIVAGYIQQARNSKIKS